MKLPGVPVLDSMGEALSKAIPEKVPASPTRSMHPAVVADNPQTGRAYDLRNFWAEGGGGAVFGYDGWAHSGPTGPVCETPWTGIRKWFEAMYSKGSFRCRERGRTTGLSSIRRV